MEEGGVADDVHTNPDEVQQCYIMTGFHTAAGGPLSIPLMQGISTELMQVNTRDDTPRNGTEGGKIALLCWGSFALLFLSQRKRSALDAAAGDAGDDLFGHEDVQQEGGQEHAHL